MQAHTPGPWHWDSDPVKGDPTGRIRFQVTAVGKTIAKTYYSSFEGGPTNAESDTRLIAAAPDLLAACQAQHVAIDILMAMLIEEKTGFLPTKSEVWPMLLAGRAAILKATGGAS